MGAEKHLSINITHWAFSIQFLLLPGFILVTYDVQSMTLSIYEQTASGSSSGPGKVGLLIFSLFMDTVCDICGISLLSKVSLSSNPRDHVKFYFS